MTMLGTKTTSTGTGNSRCHNNCSPPHLPPPPIVSARITNPLISSLSSMMLSELNFNEPLNIMESSKNNGGNYNNNNKSGDSDDESSEESEEETNNTMTSFLKSSSWNWNGLLCFMSSDPDLFFDAEEKPMFQEDNVDNNGKIIVRTTDTTCTTASSMSGSSEVLQSKESIGSSDCDESFVSVESVEVKLHKDRTVAVATICECRGGGQQQQQQQQQSPSQQQQQHNHNNGQHILPIRQLAFGIGQQQTQQQQQQQQQNHNPFLRIPAPVAPTELPVRFLRAGKGDIIEGQRRYMATLQWRKEQNIDTILFEEHFKFTMIKENYPHYFHLRGKQGEPVFYEQPPKTDLQKLKNGGVTLISLVRHYTMVTEFQWQFLESNDFARSITVLDLEGIRMMDFVGECVEYVKMCSNFSGQHYPERAGHVIVVNVPRCRHIPTLGEFNAVLFVSRFFLCVWVLVLVGFVMFDVRSGYQQVHAMKASNH
ncbi:hypothetical protein FRACYDRAFT_235346 [Fragilariopsis cylindrus CCMP1102]|uniref:CRAL-TRIO domain-containing protein n=1 Tax=Fragilariopsis cylindrus CCMP1102 TaxID=635003 RepID=A0A1E7FMD6_9STRA|nr:hypothetical protein FRACYDRAFT_235346 [Fragilariopsis cylindrus CCMP1102]|eukprot:OEU19297.1 hypothetical protein FRACYDRAFT_235346 [Fragilariopsis cylindrus CCMP1102]